ncbi:MAG: CoA-binding protein [Ardenticatenaceae bacterium]|nr:CoA-binding protein [Ardenticatenaceae bacterium]HBY97770.1 CoA-binding protein [Chloroflexota bacterium]
MRSTTELIEAFVNYRRWAVVGVSHNPSKFGHIILNDLRRAGYDVQAVGRSGGMLDGAPIYPSLAALPERPEVVDVVVPPAQAELIVRQCAELGLQRVWLQPGAESPAVVAFCRANGIEVIAGGPCAMVHKRRWSSLG